MIEKIITQEDVQKIADAMSKVGISVEEMNKNVEKLNEALKAYNEGHPTMSDKEWDNLYFDLLKQERSLGFVLPNSPTTYITDPSVSSLRKVEHNHKMLSLEKTKELGEILDFTTKRDCLAMLKMDGLTCSLRYINGNLVGAETRGNGLIGEDILHNAQFVQSIPKKIPYTDELVVDGEIICTYKNFSKFNTDYKNPRNFAAGSIRLLNGKECEERHLTFVAWDIIKGYESINTLSDALDNLAYLGFIPVPRILIPKEVYRIDNLQYYVKLLQQTAQGLSFPIDGLVFKYDNIEYGKSLGETSHHFKNAIAYKFYDETYATKLIDIEYDVSRNGVLTPVAVFEPVDIEGGEITRASLHNLSVMEEILGPEPFKGQPLEIYRANMIIPQIYSAKHLLEMFVTIPKEDIIEIPHVCPICGLNLYISESDTGIHTLTCVNAHCPGRLVNRLDHFCGKTGLDIKGLSVATLNKLMDWGWVENLMDIFKLKDHAQDWYTKEGFGIKSVNKILESIENSKKCTLSAFLSAIGIPFVGQQVAKDIAANVIDYPDFRDKVYDGWNFASIPNFGQAKQDAILNFNYNEADEIYHLLTVTNEQQKKTTTLDGLVFVVTGKLQSFKNRSLLKEEIEKRGGKVTDSVSAKTNYLINNDKESTSSKNLKAKQLNIPIISEQEFLEMIK